MNVTSKFSPGPWRTVKAHPRTICNRGGDKYIAKALVGDDQRTSPRFLRDLDMAEANARLLAAAPEMFDLLKRAGDASSPNDDVRTAWWEARNTILVKAETVP